jgi:hypothetical protein
MARMGTVTATSFWQYLSMSQTGQNWSATGRLDSIARNKPEMGERVGPTRFQQIQIGHGRFYLSSIMYF